MDDLTNQPGRKIEDYEALVKLGDAVETPDGELWIVEAIDSGELWLTSAYRDSEGRIYADVYEQTRTVVPSQLANKVADARQVRRP